MSDELPKTCQPEQDGKIMNFNHHSSIDELICFIKTHSWNMSLPDFLVRRFLTELVSDQKLILDLFDHKGRIAVAVLIDKIENMANDCNLEILGMRQDADVELVISHLIDQAKHRFSLERNGIQLTFPTSKEIPPEFLAMNNFSPYFETINLQKNSLDDVRTFNHPNIQPANIDQAEKLFHVLQESFAQNPEINFPPFLTYQQTFSNNCYHYYSWRESDFVSGILKLVTEENTKSVEINTIGVLKQFRGKGIGATLLNFALSEAKKMNFTKCHLCVAVNNQNALNLYLSAGFMITDRSQTFRWQREKNRPD